MKNEPNIWNEVSHEFVKNDNVKLHVTSLGEGPVAIMLHGFPDFWYTWRHQIADLSDRYKVVSVDLRGYNKSDKPKGVENYTLEPLIEDVLAVIRHFKEDKAVLIGNDWGGFIAWSTAMLKPEKVEKLIACNIPHPNGLIRELAENPKQRENSKYAREFQKEGAYKKLTAKYLSDWVANQETREKYLKAFKKSDFEAMLNYYKANYPKEPYDKSPPEMPQVKCPVLMIHGLEDWALLPSTLKGTWNWVDNELTIVTLPQAGHFVQQDAPDRVNHIIKRWVE